MDLWTVIVQAANLLVLTWILKKLLFRPVQGILLARKREIEDTYAAAEDEKRAAQRMKAAYRDKLSGAEMELEEMRQSAEAEMEKRRAELLDRAKGEAAHIRANAQRQGERERMRARAELQKEAALLAVDIAEKLLRREIDRKDQRRLLEEFVRNVEDKA